MGGIGERVLMSLQKTIYCAVMSKEEKIVTNLAILLTAFSLVHFFAARVVSVCQCLMQGPQVSQNRTNRARNHWYWSKSLTGFYILAALKLQTPPYATTTNPLLTCPIDLRESAIETMVYGLAVGAILIIASGFMRLFGTANVMTIVIILVFVASFLNIGDIATLEAKIAEQNMPDSVQNVASCLGELIKGKCENIPTVIRGLV